MFQDISVDKLLEMQEKGELVLVDVRSQSEYKEATIPGSLNIPLFNDEERAEIGTTYKQVSIPAAKERGLEIVSSKLPSFIKEFTKIPGPKVVFCWRGGMRSKTSATLLDLMGVKTFRLQGGIREYRKWIVGALENLEQDFQPAAFVLNGYTGSGKTTIIKKLQDEGLPVFDSEGLANHRGSIFGQIGLKPHNQKTFDTLFVKQALKYQHSPFVLFEAESKRVGRVILPEFLIRKKEQGTQIFIHMPIEERVLNILEDYQPWEHHEECLEAFRRIKKHIHTPIAAQIETDLVTGDYQSAVRLLLEYYYDPRYQYTAVQHPEERTISLQVKNTDEAVVLIRNILRKQKSTQS